MAGDPIYLDHHATTPVDRRVVQAMLPFFSERYGNAASSTHRFGREARQAVEEARAEIANWLGTAADEVVFTSGATESDNLAILGTARALRDRGRHVVTLRTEHRAVLDSCRALEKEGWRVTYLDVDEKGLVSADEVAEALTEDTVLLSVMLANNEIGVVQDIRALSALAAERGVLFHCDAAQGLGYLSDPVADADLISLSAHKIYGPKGIGALVVRESARDQGAPAALVHGGGHEGGLRSGTLDVPSIVGFGQAAALMRHEGAAEAVRLASLRDELRDRLLAVEHARLNGSSDRRHPGNLNVSFGFVEGAALLLAVSDRIAVSSGAACSSAVPGPSYVLEALGVPKEEAAASIRFGVGRETTEAHIEAAGDVVVDAVAALRERSPHWKRRALGKPVDW
ncbi:MAG: aminotransferase class V-fold PLP-dependent enzyme [Myxococcota bacterium]